MYFDGEVISDMAFHQNQHHRTRNRYFYALPGFLAALILLLIPAFSVSAANTDSTVYVRKHVCLLYDDSGSMNYDPRWSYASYAAQTFAGLLNDTDTLTILRMNQGKLDVDLSKNADRAAEVTKILEGTQNPSGETPAKSITEARTILTQEGLKSDAELARVAEAAAEQYWLVLTTDGVFDDNNYKNVKTEEEIAEQQKSIQRDLLGYLEKVTEGYSSLHLVYFGIGSKDETQPKKKAVDFSEMLTSDDPEIRSRAAGLAERANFTAVYASSADKIVETMQGLSTQIAGRYEVTDDVSVSGNEVTLFIDAESSPIRNIAVLAQNTDAELTEAVCADGTKLKVGQKTRLSYPRDENLKNIETSDGNPPKGGCTALVQVDTEEEARIPAGKVTLRFSRPVVQKDLSLMYEPAIYLSAIVEQQGADGNWVEIPEGEEMSAGTKTRVSYQICEMGTGRELDAAKLFGKTEAIITVNGERVDPGEAIELPEGSSMVNIDLSMMDGGYKLTKTRQIDAAAALPAEAELVVKSSGPLTIKAKDLETNTNQAIEFTITYGGAPVNDKVMAELGIDTSVLPGETSVKGNVLRFVPKGKAQTGEYVVPLTYTGRKTKFSEKVTVTMEAADYEVTTGGPLVISCLDLQANTDRSVDFTITYGGTAPNESQMAEFAVVSESKDLNGECKIEGNVVHFIPNGDVPAGDYRVNLTWQGQPTQWSETVTATVEASDLSAVSSGPIELTCHELETNKDKSIEFTVTYGGQPAGEDLLSSLTLDVPLKGDIAVEPGKIRFTPKDKVDEGEYPVSLCHGDTELVQEKVTVKIDVTYTAEASPALSLMDNEIEGSGAMVTFVITAHTDKEDRPITADEAELFRTEIRAGRSGGTDSDAGADDASGRAVGNLAVTDTFQEGVLALMIQPDSDPGDYTIALIYDGTPDAPLAQTAVSILEHDVVYTVEAFPSDPNLVDRIFPEQRNAQVAFVLTADGKPCTAERLEALLGSSITVTGEPANSILKVSTEVGIYNGQAAIFTIPDSQKKWFIPRLIYRMRAAWNGVLLGDWNLTLTVNLPQGSAATGTLVVTDIFFWRMFYRLLPCVLFVIALLIFMFIYSNLAMMRLMPGTLEYICLGRTGARGTNIEYISMDTPGRSLPVRQGIFFRLTPKPQVIENFHEKKFVADGISLKKPSFSFLRYGKAKVSWKDDGDIANYCWQQNGMRAADDEGNLLIEGGIFDQSIDANLSGSPIEEKSDNDKPGRRWKLKRKKKKKSKISRHGGGIHAAEENPEEEQDIVLGHVPEGRRCTWLGVGELLIHRIYTGNSEIDRKYPETIEIWCHRPPEKARKEEMGEQERVQKFASGRTEDTSKPVKKLGKKRKK